jgi:stage V sporulation protein B
LSEIDIAAQSARGSLILLVGNLIQALAGLVFVVTVARLLGPNGYGVYTLSLIIPLTIQSLVGIGISSGITRYAAYHISKGESDIAKRITLNGILFLLGLGAILTAVTYVGVDYLNALILHRTDLSGVARLASIAIIAQTLFQTTIAGLLGWRSMEGISIANVAWGFLRLAIAVPLILVGFSVAGAVLGYVIATLVSGAIAFLLLYGRLRGVGAVLPRRFTEDVRSILLYSGPLYVGSVATTVASQYVLIVLADISSNSVVGTYQSALNVLIAISIMSAAISQTLFPAFAHLEGAKAHVGLAFRYAVKYNAFFVSPTIFFLAAAARPIFDVLYGTTFSLGVPYLLLLSLSNTPLILGFGILPSLFMGVGKPRLFMLFNLAYAASQIVLAPLLAIGIGLGVPGLILSILLSSLVALAVGLRYSFSELQASVDWPKIGVITLSSLLSSAAVLALGKIFLDSVLVLVPDLVIFAIVYLTLVPIGKGLDALDLLRLDDAIADSRVLRTFLRPVLAYELFISRVFWREPPVATDGTSG